MLLQRGNLGVCVPSEFLAQIKSCFSRFEDSNHRKYFLVKINKAGIGIDWKLVIRWREGLSSLTKNLFAKSSLRVVNAVVQNLVGLNVRNVSFVTFVLFRNFLNHYHI